MALPAVAATAAGTLLVPQRIAADVVFVAVMVGAVYVRRYGPRGFALGQIAFMTFFFTQFLQAQPSQLPWLIVAVLIGLAATLLLRGVVFAERRERTLRRLVAAFRARAYAVLGPSTPCSRRWARPSRRAGEVDEGVLDRMRLARARLNDVALQVENELEQTTAGRVWPGLSNETLALRIVDAELALERLTVAVRRLVRPPEGSGVDQRPDAGGVAALRVGVAHLRTRPVRAHRARRDPRRRRRRPRSRRGPGGAHRDRAVSACSARPSPSGAWPTRCTTRSATPRRGPAGRGGRAPRCTTRSTTTSATRRPRDAPARAEPTTDRHVLDRPSRRRRRRGRGPQRHPRPRRARAVHPAGRAGRGGDDARDRRRGAAGAVTVVLGGDRGVRDLHRHAEPGRPAQPRVGPGARARSAGWRPGWAWRRWWAATGCSRSSCCSPACSSRCTWCGSRRPCSRSGSPRCSPWSTG